VKQAASDLVRWSTEDVDVPQRVAYYAAALESAVDPMCVSSVAQATFAANITSTALGPLSAVHVQGEAHSLRRGRNEVARSAEPHFRLIVNRTSSWTLQQHDTHECRPLDVALIDSRYPHMTDLPSAFDVLHLKLPEAWVRQWVPQAERIAGRPIRFDRRWGGALSSFVVQMSPEFAARSPLPLSLVADHLGALLSLAAGPLAGGMAPVPAGTLAARIRDSIIQRSPEMFLTAVDIASSLQISVRTLHRSLASSGQTFATVLMDARAAQALRMLESAMFAAVNVAEIGRRCGFPDASHFTRVVRRRTGRAPLQIQRACASGRRG